MAGNSNNKQNKNNNRNPTLRDHERMTGKSGHAIHEKGVLGTSGTDSSDLGASSGTERHRTDSRDSGHR